MPKFEMWIISDFIYFRHSSIVSRKFLTKVQLFSIVVFRDTPFDKSSGLIMPDLIPAAD